MARSPFRYADTASARQHTTDLAMRLQDEKVAIVGVGGTGSYVLDFVAKTWVAEIHVFDCDDFLQHNAFRAPGSFALEDVGGEPNKATFHAARYGAVHGGLVPHPVAIGPSNVDLLATVDTVFICKDGGGVKRLILDACVGSGTTVIDCGMGVKRSNGGRRPLLGTLRVTTCTPDRNRHAADCIDFSPDVDPADEYERNIQVAELNALNAAMAVIKWKKLRGIYDDRSDELHSLYVVDGNRLINRYGRV